MCDVSRGKQFSAFPPPKKSMTVAGSRQAMGGAVGDALGFYANFEVESAAGVKLGLNFARVCILIEEVFAADCF